MRARLIRPAVAVGCVVARRWLDDRIVVRRWCWADGRSMMDGVKIAAVQFEVADGDKSVILEQVTNGQAVRMAVLYLLSGRKKEDGE